MATLRKLWHLPFHGLDKDILKLYDFYIFLGINQVGRQKFMHYLKVGATVSGRTYRGSASGQQLERQSVRLLAYAVVLDERVIDVPENERLREMRNNTR
jgi:hypothetical protein